MTRAPCFGSVLFAALLALSGAARSFAGDPTLGAAGANGLENRLPPPIATVGFVASLFQVADGSGSVPIGVALNHAATAPVTVTYATADASGHAGLDYTPARGTLTFAPGQVYASFAVPILRTDAASSRTVALQLSAASGAATLGPVDLALLNVRAAPATPVARLITPRPGARLPGNAMRFLWRGSAAGEYWLAVGVTPGGAEIFNRHVGRNTMVTVAGLPADGRTVYAQLWTRAGAGWDLSAAAFESAGAPVVLKPQAPVPLPPTLPATVVQPAALTGRLVRPGWLMPANLTAPAAGTTLPAGAATFTWESAAWATGYTLDVLSGASVLATQDAGAATSASVSGLPSDGRALTVRVTTRFAGGVTMSSQASYVAATSAYSAAQLHNLTVINNYRATQGLAALALDTQLTAFAQAGSAQLSVDHLPHQHFINASNAGTMFAGDGFRSSAAENQGDPNGWTVLSSDPAANVIAQIDAIQQVMFNEGPGGGHHDNMMGNFTRVGVGLVTISGKLYLTNDFSR